MSELNLDKSKIIKIFTSGTPENDSYGEYLNEYKDFLILKEKFLINKAKGKTIKCPLTNKKTDNLTITINNEGIMRIDCDGSFKTIKPPKYLYIDKEIENYINEIHIISNDLGNLRNKLKNIEHTSEILDEYEERFDDESDSLFSDEE